MHATVDAFTNSIEWLTVKYVFQQFDIIIVPGKIYFLLSVQVLPVSGLQPEPGNTLPNRAQCPQKPTDLQQPDRGGTFFYRTLIHQSQQLVPVRRLEPYLPL